MVELYILGPAEIRNTDGALEQSFLAGPKRLALLVYLLLYRPRGYHRRDKLLPLFWPEHGQKSARNALSNMLYHIRKTLGKEAIENRGSEEIKINPKAFWSDALVFEQAIQAEDHQSALRLYRSDLLNGFHVHDISVEFDYWLEQERDRFRALATEGSWALAEKALSKHDHPTAKDWAKKAAALNPFAEQVQLKLFSFLDRSGDPTAALEAYQSFSRLIQKEWDEAPGAELTMLAKAIKSRTPPIPKPSGKEASFPVKNIQSSIAVLPFETLGLEETSAFTDAIYGDILTRLSQISDLSVTSRTSAMSYRWSVRLLPEIARDLHVGWILTGEVQEYDKQVKVSVRLVNALEDRQVWADIFQRKLTAGGLFQIQAEITQKITEALKMKLSKKEVNALRQVPTDNLEAFRLHACGRWSLDQRTEKSMRMAEEYFRQAIAHDPDYAQAWLGLADTLSLLHDYGHEDNTEAVLPAAEEAARKALSLDPLLAEAYASLGLLHTTRRKGEAAIQDLEKAVNLQPSYADAHAWLSWIYVLTGSRREALECSKKAVNLNPLSSESISGLSLTWLSNRSYENALLEAERLRLLYPDYTSAQLLQGVALYHLGRFKEAGDVLQDLHVPWAGNGAQVTRILSYLDLGDTFKAEMLMEKIQDDEFSLALIGAAMGEREAAFQVFTKFEEWNYWEMLSMHYLYPAILDPIREDDRFEQVLQQLNKSWGIEHFNKPLQIDQQNSAFADNGPLSGSLTVTRPHQKFREREGGVGSLSKNSIAVLPFKTGAMQELLFFTEGIHGDILRGLSSIKDLQVISRTSVYHYVKTDKGASEIGKELNVCWLLEGEVSELAGEIRIAIGLLNVATERPVWFKVYQRQLTAENIFHLEENIIEDLLHLLKVQQTTKEKQRVVQNSTTDLNAYRMYAQGRSNLDQRTAPGIYQGLDCFQTCIELDPHYALAWSGLADALSLLQYYGFSIPKNSPDALAAATKSVNLCSKLGEAHTSLGIVYANQQQGVAALRALEHALYLTPGYAEVLGWLGWLYLMLGRPKKALEPALKAVRLNPLAPAFRIFLAEIYLANGAYEKALFEAKRAREINPDYGLVHYMEGLVRYHLGHLEEALVALRKALSLVPVMGTPSQAEVKTALAFTHFALGEVQEALDIRNQTYNRIDPFPLGLLHSLLGQLDEAFSAFSRVQDWGSFSTEQIRYFYPEALAPLRKDKRFQQLIVHVNQAWGLLADGSLP